MLYDAPVSERKTKVIPIRMDSNLQERVRKAGRRLGSNSSSVIRLSILTILPQIEEGTISVPIHHEGGR